MTRVHWSRRANRRHPALLYRGWLLLLLGLGLALVSCGSEFTCRGCVENVKPGHVLYRYHFFSGPFTRTVNASDGQTLKMDYAATVEQGTLDMRLVNPGGEAVWQETFDTGEDVASSTQIDIQQNGRYQLVVEGH
ncbi:MAG: hypothetical protein ACK2U9_22735, partial [Anaerolineae bacterium]